MAGFVCHEGRGPDLSHTTRAAAKSAGDKGRPTSDIHAVIMKSASIWTPDRGHRLSVMEEYGARAPGATRLPASVMNGRSADLTPRMPYFAGFRLLTTQTFRREGERCVTGSRQPHAWPVYRPSLFWVPPVPDSCEVRVAGRDVACWSHSKHPVAGLRPMR